MKKKLTALLCIITLAVSLFGCNKSVSPEEVNTTESALGELLTTESPSSEDEPETESEMESATEENNVGGLYEAFLFEDAKSNCTLENGDAGEYSLVELIEYYDNYFESEFGGEGEDSILPQEKMYGYIDCGLDGTDELVVYQRYDWVGCDEFCCYFIFNAVDGHVNLIDQERHSSRGYVEINQAGVITSGGSNGASSHSYDISFINAEGKLITDFKSETYSSLPKALAPYYCIPDNIRPADYPMDLYSYGDDYSFYCEAYTFESYDYYGDMDEDSYNSFLSSYFYCFYDSEGNDVEPDSSYKGFYDEHGIAYYTQEEITQIIADHEKEMGMPEGALDYDDVALTEF